MAQPPGFVDKHFPNHICKLKKAIYGLKQAPRAWYNELRQFLLQIGFVNSVADSSLFIYNKHTARIYLLVYVDDIIVTGNTISMLVVVTKRLSSRFSLKDLGPLTYFLGVEVQHHSHGLFLNQRKYIQDLLLKAKMDESRPISTLMCTTTSLTKQSGSPLELATEYRMLVGSLQYHH